MTGKAVLVVAFEQPGDTNEAVKRLTEIADGVRSHFNGQTVKVYVGIRETADDVIKIFEGA